MRRMPCTPLKPSCRRVLGIESGKGKGFAGWGAHARAWVAMQGPFGHYLPTFFFPIHPVALAAFGFLSSVFAVAAVRVGTLCCWCKASGLSKGRCSTMAGNGT